MRQSNLLIINTLLTYLRMAVTVGMGLFATRILLRELGPEDFGLLAVLGASGAFFLVFMEGLTTSVQRHLAYELGRNDLARLARVFNSSFLLFIFLGGAFLLISGLSGPAILGVLKIPPQRMDASWWVYYLSIINISIMMLGIPYTAVVEARQAAVLRMLFGTMESLILLACAVVIIYTHDDKLIAYSLALLGLKLIETLCKALIVMGVYPESRVHLMLSDRKEVWKILSMAGWTILGSGAWRLRTQGCQIVMNLAHGPLANSSYAIAGQLAGYQNTFSGSIYTVARAATISLYAKDAKDRVQELVLLSCKYASLLSVIVCVPILIDVDNILHLWLDSVPPMAGLFTILVVVWNYLLRLSGGYYMAMLGYGKIGKYMIAMAVLDVAVPLTALTLYLTGKLPLWGIPAIEIHYSLLQVFFQVFYVGRIIQISPWSWVKNILVPSVLVLTSVMAVTLIPRLSMDPGWYRLGAILICSACTAIPTIWWFALRSNERQRFLVFLQQGLERVAKKTP